MTRGNKFDSFILIWKDETVNIPIEVYVFFCLSILLIFSFVLVKRVKISWINNSVRLIIASLPLERIPSVNFGGGNIRLSQVFSLLGAYFLTLCLIKRDQAVLNKKISGYCLIPAVFLAFSTPSFLQIIDPIRAISTLVSTLIVFLAFFLISNFAGNIKTHLFDVFSVIFICCLFGIYQFFGDILNIPTEFTGLRSIYTKELFSIPRIHSTALEPLYWAGMLFIPIFLVLFMVFDPKFATQYFKYLKINPIISNFLLKNQQNLTVLLIMPIIIFNFIFSLSQGAWFAIAPGLAVLLFINREIISNWIKFIQKNTTFVLFKLIIPLFGFVLTLGFIFQKTILTSFEKFYNHFELTLIGKSGSASQRLGFLDDAYALLKLNPLFGIGPGQFGANVSPGEAGNFLIINNVYLEIWLEMGFIPLLIFLIFIFLPFALVYKKQIKVNTVNLILLLSLFSYNIQWFFFSPIFIMPIFIILGMIYSQTNNSTD